MKDIRNIDWGNDSAENDPALMTYFVTPLNFDRITQFKKTFIIGRKGAGKTAIRKKLISKFADEREHIVVEVSPTNGIFRNLAGVDLLKQERGDETIFQYAWLNSIMRKCLNLIGSVQDNKLTVGSAEAARKFAKAEGVVNSDFVESVTTILSSIKLKFKDIGELGLQLENIIKESSAIDRYEYHLKNLAKDGCKITILVDDLDIGWDNSDRSNQILLGLLTSSMYLKAIHANVNLIIFIRDDIYSILMKKTTHSDKYRDVYKITWADDNFQKLLAERISQSLDSMPSVEIQTDFLRVFPEKIGNQFTLGWMTERTLGRPRELLQLSRLYTEALSENSPSDDTLKDVEEEYSTWKKEDLCAEFVNQYPDLDKIFDYWRNNYFRTKYQIDEDTLEARMSKILDEVRIPHDWFVNLSNNADTKGLAKILFDIGFFGDFIRGGDGGSKVSYFGETQNPLLKEVQVHPCFRKAVGTVQRNR
ncbi:hypothetical protein HT094_10410 [Shewanella sp. ZOR0012]|uniref:P-loop ATPase, Sll1717 family n=1 Tax=Shewanella sp. ZOR0012 TaxID=1339231 RepID=UPI000648E41E|nr:hypothetical protein [Shewanella sp. ZOR0012]NSM24711.1 hypothetical protein [Shewanella sp. ZOR0012]